MSIIGRPGWLLKNIVEGSERERMTTTTTIERMTAADLGVTLKGEGSPEGRAIIEDIDKYLAVFAKPIERGGSPEGFVLGKHACLKCGSALDGMLGSFQWGLAHGEGTCSKCGWPARMYHWIKDREGKELFTSRISLILQYHPDQIASDGTK